jgi:pyruvate/2-oxoglutarate dehydrogenase complex dihydrolipoamide acyltransferase (E2) component
MESVDQTEFCFVATTALLMTLKTINKIRNSYSPKKHFMIKQEKVVEEIIPSPKFEKIKKENKFASSTAKWFARVNGVSQDEIEIGTGKNGKITKTDIEVLLLEAPRSPRDLSTRRSQRIRNKRRIPQKLIEDFLHSNDEEKEDIA